MQIHPGVRLSWRQLAPAAILLGALAYSSSAQTIRVDVKPSHSTNSFKPTEALGAGVDRIPLAATDKIFTEPVLRQILSTGWQTVTYRQNTELYVEAWHWNPKGTWSEPDQKGYFVGDATPTEFIRHSFGYPLPHAGFSQPDGRGYSRLTDGDTGTYWKSNPYLTKAYTGEDDASSDGLLLISPVCSTSMPFKLTGRSIRQALPRAILEWRESDSRSRAGSG
jgi:hypothetical protein